jgi:AbrB family looped-hinge helix DNA binding protein
MGEFEVTKLGERGQVVIPQEFRKNLGLKCGDKFMVIERDGALMFKRLSAPSIEEFDAMIRRGHKRAKRLNLTSKELDEVRKRARSKK